MNQKIQPKANQNIGDILKFSIKYNPEVEKALIIFDSQTDLSQILTYAYRKNLPNGQFVDFDSTSQEELIELFDNLNNRDLVVLIQSSNFRLNDFRIRLNLFNRGLKVVEHMHLYRNHKSTWGIYIDSLAYDLHYLINQSCNLNKVLTEASLLSVEYKGHNCFVDSKLEIPKLNIGQYDGMVNIGGTYPIGEIFTESQVLDKVNGRIYVYAFANSSFEVELAPIPFYLEIQFGKIIEWDKTTPKSFIEVLEKVKQSEDLVIRELGFGINKAFSKNPELLIKDITAFERICGMHMSIGQKHSMYKKSKYPSHKARYHIDIFIQADIIKTDKVTIWEGEVYKI